MKVIGSILPLIALYVLFFFDDGALFVQPVDRPGARFAEVLNQ